MFSKLFKNFSSKKTLPNATVDYNYFFEASLHDGIKLNLVELGKLHVPTGEIVVCDPLVMLGETKPFLRNIHPGDLSVFVVEAETPDMGNRFAFAKLEITKEKPVKWELAVTEDDMKNTHKFKDGEFIGFPVDAGLGSFCDNLTQQQYKKFHEELLSKKPETNMYDDFFAEKFKKNAKNPDDPQDIGDWLNFTVPDTKNNIIMFSSGFGDGMYPSYWGLNEKGEVCSLLIDFMLFQNQ